MSVSTGIHHITAICTTPSENKQFYEEVLGLAFVKKTVNHDDPTTYHLYYGDEQASPGTLITFFPWMHLPQATPGAGEVERFSFAVPKESLEYWRKRLKKHNVEVSEPKQRFDESFIEFSDPHGLRLAIVETHDCDKRHAPNSDVPIEHAIHGFHSATLCVNDKEHTEHLLIEMGYTSVAEYESYTRLENIHSDFQTCVDLHEQPNLPLSRQGIGSVHHIAFRVDDDKKEVELKAHIHELGMRETPVIDRKYFHSVYFRIPAGVLFEIATDGPGFGVDEDMDKLGQTLVLPERLEPMRKQIEENLPPL